jgi:hypothetical protein
MPSLPFGGGVGGARYTVPLGHHPDNTVRPKAWLGQGGQGGLETGVVVDVEKPIRRSSGRRFNLVVVSRWMKPGQHNGHFSDGQDETLISDASCRPEARSTCHLPQGG